MLIVRDHDGVRNRGLRVGQIGAVSGSPLINWMTLGSLVDLSILHFSDLENGDKKIVPTSKGWSEVWG